MVFGRRNSSAARDNLWISAPRKARHPDSPSGTSSRNRWHLKPRLANLAAHDEFEKIPALLAQLQHGVIAEVSLGARHSADRRHDEHHSAGPLTFNRIWPFSFRLDWSNLAASADVRFLTNTGAALSIVGIVLLASAVFDPTPTVSG